MAKRRVALGDKKAEEMGAEDLTTKDRQNLQGLLNMKTRQEKKKPGRKRGGKKANKASGSGVVEVDLEEDGMSD